MGINRALGRHVIADFFECNTGFLNDVDCISEALDRASRTAGATVLRQFFHKFEPQGVTGVLILAESHLTIHTWPEFAYASVDAFTCSKRDFTLAMVDIRLALGAAFHKMIEIERGRIPSIYLDRYLDANGNLKEDVARIHTDA